MSFNSNIQDWSFFMRRAIQLASLAEGNTSPNPLVGAIVLAKNGSIVGEGFHAKAGDSHAEVGALIQAKNATEEGTLIVTLEPCCHQGRTPPCTDLIIQSGIKRVVVGLQDPDSRVSGKGIYLLREAGIEVIENVLEKEIAFQNRAFVHRIRTGRPWGILKCAMSIDGRISLPNGDSKWITSKDSRSRVHGLRSKCDAVIVGGETLRKDDPLLTSRGISDPEPLRVVFTFSAQLPQTAQLWDTSKARTLIAYSADSDICFVNKFPKGIEKIKLEKSNPTELLNELAKKGCNKVLWECGPDLATIAVQENCVQELILFISPKILGGLSARTVFSDFGFKSIDKSIGLETISFEKIGKDFVLNMIV